MNRRRSAGLGVQRNETVRSLMPILLQALLLLDTHCPEHVPCFLFAPLCVFPAGSRFSGKRSLFFVCPSAGLGVKRNEAIRSWIPILLQALLLLDPHCPEHVPCFLFAPLCVFPAGSRFYGKRSLFFVCPSAGLGVKRNEAIPDSYTHLSSHAPGINPACRLLLD